MTSNPSNGLEAWGKIAQKIRVPAGTVIGILFLILIHPSRRSLIIGGIVTAVGAGLRVWAAGHIEKGRVLTCGGPYAFTRNPLYLGSLIMAVGVLIAGQGYWLLPPFALLFAALYYPVMRAEERELQAGHGSQFETYAGLVPLFLPRLQSTGAGGSVFRWARVVRNREPRTLLGLLLIELVLCAKLLANEVLLFIKHLS